MTGRTGRTGRDERGSGTLLVVGVMAVVGVVASVAMVAAAYLVAGHRARGAADLAALSGAAAYAQGRSACTDAARLARANDARLVGCGHVGDDVDYVVSVTVRVDVGLHVPGLPRSLTVGARGTRSVTRAGRANGGRTGGVRGTCRPEPTRPAGPAWHRTSALCG